MLESGFPDGSFVDTEPFLKKAAVIGAFLDVEEIVALRKGLSTVHALVAFFGGREDEKYPRLRIVFSFALIFFKISSPFSEGNTLK